MIFLDSNVPMYLVGAEHPNKHAARRILERSIASGARMVTDVEVIQEILHRYVAIRRRDAIEPCVRALLELTDDVYDVDLSIALEARDLVLEHPALSARDALHVAVMRRHGIRKIMSFDAGFDSVEGLERLHA